MGTTTRGYRYPELADVPDGPAQIKALAEDVDANVTATLLPLAGGTLTGLLLIPEGTAATPALAFASDSDTGFYRIGANNIGVASGGTLGVRLAQGVFPGSDGGQSLGNAGLRWSQLFATTTTISTSDETAKDSITASDLGLAFILGLRPLRYRMKGGTRPHYGLSAQQVKETMDIQGVTDAAFYIDPAIGAATREAAGSPQKAKDESGADHAARVQAWRDDIAVEKAAPKGLRYSEFIAPLIKAVQEQQEQIYDLTARVAALEAAEV